MKKQKNYLMLKFACVITCVCRLKPSAAAEIPLEWDERLSEGSR
jgi:hypothetical protein